MVLVRVLSTWYDQAAGRHRGMHACIQYLVQVLHTTCTWYQVLVAPGIYGRRASVQVLLGTWYKGTSTVYIRYSYSTTEIVHVCACILRTTSTGGVYSVWYSEYVVLGVQYCLRSTVCYAPTNLSWYHTGVLVPGTILYFQYWYWHDGVLR